MKRKGADYHHGDLRRTLVEATLRLVAENGTEGFTLRAAAQLAGVSDGAPYHHFADREALLAAAAVEGYRALAERMSRAEEAEPDERAKSRAVARAYVLFALESPAAFRLMFGPLVEHRRRHPALAKAASQLLVRIRRAFGEATPERAALRVSPVAALALVHGVSLLAIDGHLGAEGRSARVLERLVVDAWASLEASERRPGERESEAPRSARRPKPGREPGHAAFRR